MRDKIPNIPHRFFFVARRSGLKITGSFRARLPLRLSLPARRKKILACGLPVLLSVCLNSVAGFALDFRSEVVLYVQDRAVGAHSARGERGSQRKSWR